MRDLEPRDFKALVCFGVRTELLAGLLHPLGHARQVGFEQIGIEDQRGRGDLTFREHLNYDNAVLAPLPLLSGSNRISALRPTAVNAILTEMRILQSQGKSLISLMRGEPDFLRPHISWKPRSARCAMDARLIRTIAERKGFARRQRKNLNATIACNSIRKNEVLATTGATLGVYAALMAVLNEGDEVLLPIRYMTLINRRSGWRAGRSGRSDRKFARDDLSSPKKRWKGHGRRR